MEGNTSLRELRRFTLDDDTDLDALQQDFFNSNSKPAATVVRRGQAPPVVAAGSAGGNAANTSTPPTKREDKQKASASDGDMLAFARSMAEAIKEFEVKEKSTDLHPVKEAPEFEPVPQGKPKKLSLFAQRRLAKQQQQQKEEGSTVGLSGTAGPSAGSSAATFLPKLMAPVAEHTPTEPARPPEQKPRESGFPEIPVDFTMANDSAPSNTYAATRTRTDTAPAARTGDPQSAEYWADVRSQVSEENRDRMMSMTEAEILEAQDEIRSAISSETLQRVLRRKKQAVGGNNNNRAQEPSADQEPPTAQVEKSDKPSKQVRFAESVTDTPAGVPPPPPPAEWVDETSSAPADTSYVNVDDNSTGADSEFYKETKRQLFPPEKVEDAQLAWMMGHKQAKSPMERALHETRQQQARAANAVGGSTNNNNNDDDASLLARASSRVRFAFDGQIMGEEQSDIPTSAGLHHHGDDPDKPGYTIPELLHLSRSTVSAQRSVAMATLGNIVHKINAGVWDPVQAAGAYTALLDWQAELYFAHGISDSSKTARAETAMSLWTWVVETSRYKTLLRLATGGDLEPSDASLPGAEFEMKPAPVAVKGVLVERTFAALSSMLTTKFMDAVCENISMSLMPEQQLTMLAECIKTLAGVSDEFDDRIKAHPKLPMLLQNKYPYLMNKP